MAKNLVIVESPAKVHTIKKFLGSSYEVLASQGHVRDLPKSQMGVDVENGFEPKYITIRGKGDLLSSLRKEVKKADTIYLATDPDREGEAISWHLTKAINMDDKKVKRITFNEITKGAVKEALKRPRDIDMNLVDAQQARRVLDRVVGYRISPILWAKVKRGLSAGRVQSVALRIICDRENEIAAFVPEEYWTIEASLTSKNQKKPIIAKYYGEGDRKVSVTSKEQADRIVSEAKKEAFRVSEVKTGVRTRKAPLPFTTSTLQQEASRVLNFTTQKTMRIAQQLYEGVAVKGHGTVGLISYLRTDSTRISADAEAMAENYIRSHYGEKYAAKTVRTGKDDKKIQDAHEAIRPTDLDLDPVTIKDSLSRDQLRLYQLIYRRFLASRMENAKFETTAVDIDAGKHRFTVSASKVIFDGFMCVYTQEEKEEANTLTSSLDEGDVLDLSGIEGTQHFTEPKPHYTEASLVKALEELGIGRPSTYAPTIGVLLNRRYVAKEGRNLFVTEIGEVVNQMMVEAFPEIVDVNFTANMEALLDGVEEGSVKWKTIIENFYPDLDSAAKKAESELGEVKIADELSDEICEMCGRRMVIKY
nr:type I DNA topoisomerase [Lachnospiraceae bacterium]